MRAISWCKDWLAAWARDWWTKWLGFREGWTLPRVLTQNPFRPPDPRKAKSFQATRTWSKEWSPADHDDVSRAREWADLKYTETHAMWDKLEAKAGELMKTVGVIATLEFGLMNLFPLARTGVAVTSIGLLALAAIVLACAAAPQWRRTRAALPAFLDRLTKAETGESIDPANRARQTVIMVVHSAEQQRVVSEWLADRVTLATWLVAAAVSLFAAMAWRVVGCN